MTVAEVLVPLAEAQRHVLARSPIMAPARVPLDEALGLVLATDVVSPEDVPPFANTAMDGYAVRAADTRPAPVELRVVGTLAAGAAPAMAVGPGEAMRIMTGAPLPEGADAIVMVERTSTSEDGAQVRVEVSAQPSDHVRPVGDDVAAGQLLFSAGDVLSAGHLGVLASIGLTEIAVQPRARVGVLSTGDELVEGPVALQPGQIRDANRRTLIALVHEVGGQPIDLGIVADQPAALTSALVSGSRRCDAILTSGGVSVGDYDYVKLVLDRVSEGSMRWMQVAIRPAKPFAFGTIGNVPVFGLPGNTVSSMVSFECFARPALRQMMGHTGDGRLRVAARADEPMARRRDGKLHLARVVARWNPDDVTFHIRSAGGQGSHMLHAMAGANALALLPDGEGVEAGGLVETIILGGMWDHRG